MSTPPSPTDSPTTNSSNNYPLDLFAPELSDIMMNPEMIGPIHDAFANDPAGSILLRGMYVKVCRMLLQGCMRLRHDIRQLESEVSN